VRSRLVQEKIGQWPVFRLPREPQIVEVIRDVDHRVRLAGQLATQIFYLLLQ